MPTEMLMKLHYRIAEHRGTLEPPGQMQGTANVADAMPASRRIAQPTHALAGIGLAPGPCDRARTVSARVAPDAVQTPDTRRAREEGRGPVAAAKPAVPGAPDPRAASLAAQFAKLRLGSGLTGGLPLETLVTSRLNGDRFLKRLERLS